MTKSAAKELSEIFVLQSLRETAACFLFVALSLRLGLGKSCSGVFPVMATVVENELGLPASATQ